jgi:predicted O-methyltransferase YrrM
LNIKHLLPGPLRDVMRPAYQRAQRRWRESAISRKPEAWREPRERAHTTSDFDSLLQMAASEFGITQVRSEIGALIDLLRQMEPRTIVEVGTHKGGNSFLFCHAVPSAERIVGVDLCVQNSAKLIHFARAQQRYVALHGDSQTTQMKSRVLRALDGRTVDFLFIDGDHSYEGVKRDFELYAPLVRAGGLIALHDIVPDHRTRFGRETGCYAGEVHRFWSELKASHRHQELVENPDQDGFGIGVIHVD